MTKLTVPEIHLPEEPPARPSLRGRPPQAGAESDVSTLIREGFVQDARPRAVPSPNDELVAFTLQIPKRVKLDLEARVADRKRNSQPRASVKSIVLEALRATGVSSIVESDLEDGRGGWLKEAAAARRRRS